MHKYLLLLLFLIWGGTLGTIHAQRNVLTPATAKSSVSFAPKWEQIQKGMEGPVAQPEYAPPPPAIGSKAADIQSMWTVAMGHSSDIYSCIRPEQNQVSYDPHSGAIAFIHLQDIDLWGGNTQGYGGLRMDLSRDKGMTFDFDLGLLNPTDTAECRYPNIAYLNPTGWPNPNDNSWVSYTALSDSSLTWDGHFTSACNFSTTQPNGCTEDTLFTGMGASLPGGLCQSSPTEFWTVDFALSGGQPTGDIYVNKGVYANNDMSWSRTDTLSPNHFTAANAGQPFVIGPNIAFSPSGDTAWIAFLGDIVGGQDSAVNAIFIPSFDGGATWGNAIEANLSQIPWIVDSLMTLWTVYDSVNMAFVPASDGVPTLAYDYDITVDMYGMPHLVSVVGTHGNMPYEFNPALSKFLLDVNSTDGGSTFNAFLVSPVLTFRGYHGIIDTIAMDNFPQVGRSADGSHLIYSWADTDTTVSINWPIGQGFGHFVNDYPNLRMRGLRIPDGNTTCVKLVSDDDLIFSGRLFFPSLAPILIEENGSLRPATVFAEMTFWMPDRETRYHFVQSGFDFSDFYFQPGWPLLTWPHLRAGCPYLSGTSSLPENSQILAFGPNPTSGQLSVELLWDVASDMQLEVLDLQGRHVKGLANGFMEAGNHRFYTDLSGLAAGMYLLQLKGSGVHCVQRLVVE